MKRYLLSLLLPLCALAAWAEGDNRVQPAIDLVNRVCGNGASANFSFILNDDFNDGVEAFRLGGSAGAVTIEANTLSALTCGLNWYLNHEARVNIAWNNLNQAPASYPAPADTGVHVADGQYRYYLNYCTFSYSMAFWDWERWQQEIDWMALHGVNLALQVVGMDAVWYNMLTSAPFNHTPAQANAFIAGPAHQGWFFMCNLKGTGGPNPEWWYKRQAELGRKITDRMRELGIEPCLPGYYGMVTDEMAVGHTVHRYAWCGQYSPYILDHSEGAYLNSVAEKYYAEMQRVFGFTPKYYSTDPYHETDYAPASYGESDYATLVDNSWKAMKSCTQPESPVWVAQEWQTNADQSRINALADKGVNSLLLDLSSERKTYYNRFGNQNYVFCVLNNYGGNIGMHGMIENTVTRFKSMRAQSGDGTHGIYKGVGVTAEGIENNPMIYELLFELPWLGNALPTTLDEVKAWVEGYATARYGNSNSHANKAWKLAIGTVLNSKKENQQGCHEPAFAARPNLEGKDAYFWAKAEYHYDKYQIVEAANELLQVDNSTNTANYDYDLVDFTRQALTDYANTLQLDMSKSTPYTGERFKAQARGFLALMDDIDDFVGRIEDLRLGRWVAQARAIAGESGNGWTAGNAVWLEKCARMLLTTWFENSDNLTDYANREYQGLIRDYYKPRWQIYFDKLTSGQSAPNDIYYHNNVGKPFVAGVAADATVYTPPSYSESSTPYTAGGATGSVKAAAQELMAKYFGTLADGSYYSPNISNERSAVSVLKRELAGKTPDEVMAELESVFGRKTAVKAEGASNATPTSIVSYAFDLNGNGSFDDESEYSGGNLPDCPNANRRCRITMSDGAQVIIKTNVGDGEGADPEWPAIKADGRNSDAKGQYISALSINGTQVYTHSGNLNLDDPNDGPLVVINSEAVPTVNQGQSVTVSWTGTGLNYTYLSAYLDKDSNKDFEDSDCLGYNGTKGGQNTVLNSNSFSFTIPDDIPAGVTCLRLRFDGAWMLNDNNCLASNAPCLQAGSTATGKAVKPNNSTNRTVYDIHLNVVRTDWPTVAQASAETRTDQYAKQISVNGVPVAGGENGYSSHPGWHVITDVVEVPYGEDFNLGWLTNSTAKNMGLAYTRATLYLDKNADHWFDEDECLGTLGAFCSNESGMNERILSIGTDELPLGSETVLRLRFDGTWIHPSGSGSGGYTNDSWFTQAASAHDIDNTGTATYAFLPNAGATRVVYDIHIRPVVTLNVGGMVFSGATNAGEAVLNRCMSGLPGNVTLTTVATRGGNSYTVSDMTAVFEALKNVTGSTNVTLADDVTSLGEAYPAYVAQRSAGFEEPVEGTSNGYRNYHYQWDLNPALSGDYWNLNVKIHFSENKFNQYGVGVFAAGTEPTPADNSDAAKFNNSFQFYQNATDNRWNPSVLVLKYNNTTQKTSINLIGTTATFEFKYRAGTMTLTLSTDKGDSYTHTWACNVASIGNLCAMLSEGSYMEGMTYCIKDENAGSHTWLNNPHIALEPTVNRTGRHIVDADGALWGSDRKQQLQRVPSARQLGSANRFNATQSMLDIAPDAFANNSTAKMSLALQQYLMIDDLLQPGNTSIALTESSDGETGLMAKVGGKEFAEVTLDRKPSEGNWSPVVLPFDLTEQEAEDNFAQVYTFSSVTANDDNLTLHFAKNEGGMEGGVAYLVKGNGQSSVNGMAFDEKSLSADFNQGAPFEAGDYRVSVVGLYDRQSLCGENLFYFAGNKLYFAKSEVTMKGFRAYLLVEPLNAGTTAPVRQFAMSWDESLATGADSISITLTPTDCYSINGQRVARTRGLVIKDGRKVFVK